MQTEKYALEWLDQVVNITLNPATQEIGELSQGMISEIVNRSVKENSTQKSFVKQTIFFLTGSQKEERIHQYRDTLILLLDQAYENKNDIALNQAELLDACQSIIWCISNILSFVQQVSGEDHFMQQRVPFAHLKELKNNIRLRGEILRLGLLSKIGNEPVADIVMHSFERFTREYSGRQITTREVDYKIQLLDGMEKISVSQDEKLNHHELIKTLVYFNFNSRAFANYYIRSVIVSLGSHEDKVAGLLLEQKNFNQMLRKPGAILNPGFDDLHKVITNWFTQELDYLEKHGERNPPEQEKNAGPNQKPSPFKVLCFLSVDQMALLLRCMDALRIFKAKSLSSVIKSIAPFLSTPHKEQISWENMRSKSYAIEEGDRRTVLKTLESMIEWIKDYETKSS